MRLPWVVAPYPGEWLGYWLHRVAEPYGLHVADLLHIAGVTHEKRPMPTWGRLTNLGKIDLGRIKEALGEPRSKLCAMQRRISCNGPMAQVGYCRTCLLADRDAGRPLYWRRDWMDPYVGWCETHRISLSALDAGAVRPLRTSHETVLFLDSIADDHQAVSRRSGARDVVAVLKLQRALRREAAANCDAGVRPLRHLVGRIAISAARHATDRWQTLDNEPVSIGPIVWTHAPFDAGTLATMRSHRQRCALLCCAANILYAADTTGRTRLWKVLCEFDRNDFAKSLRAMADVGARPSWSEAEAHEIFTVRRSIRRPLRNLVGDRTDRKSSVASNDWHSLAGY